MYQPNQLQTKSPSLRNSISRALVALTTLGLAAIGGVQSIHATVSEFPAAPNDRSWVLTGRLNTPRYDHTATLLPSGKVLVAGGAQRLDPGLESTELYDPATGSWSRTDFNLRYRRFFHTATLLPNGKVLVAGGSGFAGLHVELYDPATGLWSSTGSLGTGRLFHTATLLPNGKVLVAGGTETMSAELYDPATGLWSSTGSLGTERFERSHHATALFASASARLAASRNFSTVYSTVGQNFAAKLCNSAERTAKAKLQITWR
jgi:hypothetical protein